MPRHYYDFVKIWLEKSQNSDHNTFIDQHEQILLSLNAEELRKSYQEKLNHIVSHSSPPPEMSDLAVTETLSSPTRAKENWGRASPRLLKSLTAPQVGWFF